MKKNITILLGPPGSGKSTQSKLISANKEFKIISMSGLLKEEIKKKHKNAKEIKKIINNGDLVPYYISCDLLFKKLKKVKKKEIIIDGFPREINQGIVFDYFTYANNYNLKKIIVLDITPKECIKRLLSRKRKDDTKKAIKERLYIYKKDTNKIINRYKNKVIKIDGKQSIEEIYFDIESVLFNK